MSWRTVGYSTKALLGRRPMFFLMFFKGSFQSPLPVACLTLAASHSSPDHFQEDQQARPRPRPQNAKTSLCSTRSIGWLQLSWRFFLDLLFLVLFLHLQTKKWWLCLAKEETRTLQLWSLGAFICWPIFQHISSGKNCRRALPLCSLWPCWARCACPARRHTQCQLAAQLPSHTSTWEE